MYSSALLSGPSLARTLLDPAAGLSAPPKRERDFTSDPGNNSTFGTLALRRTFVNNTGAALTRLRFRIVDLSTFPAPSGTADLRPVTSPSIVVTRSGDAGAVNVQGTTLEEPPAQYNGGGFNSTLGAASVALEQPLADGDRISVQLIFGIQQTGDYRVAVVIETLPFAHSSIWFAQGNTEAGLCLKSPFCPKSI